MANPVIVGMVLIVTAFGITTIISALTGKGLIKMLDREKVIKGLAICTKPGTKGCLYDLHECPYQDSGCRQQMESDALILLKEKEKDKPNGHWMPYEQDKRGYTNGFTCSRCERVIFSDHYCKMIDFDFCPYCGAYMDNAEGR